MEGLGFRGARLLLPQTTLTFVLGFSTSPGHVCVPLCPVLVAVLSPQGCGSALAGAVLPGAPGVWLGELRPKEGRSFSMELQQGWGEHWP